jgi:hypothetical protein
MEPLESGGKRTREEETPFAHGPCRGRRIRRRPGADKRKTEGGGFGGRRVDGLYMRPSTALDNGNVDMTAMHFPQGRSVYVTQFWYAKRIARDEQPGRRVRWAHGAGTCLKQRGPARGESRALFEGGEPPARRTTAGEEGENACYRRAGYRSPASAGQPRRPHGRPAAFA